MKFKYLEEGKTYTDGKDEYLVKDSLLWNIRQNRWCINTMSQVARMEFEEVPQYVTFEEAKMHMINGNESMFREEHGDLVCRIEQGAIGYENDYFVALDMKLMYFADDWVLL